MANKKPHPVRAMLLANFDEWIHQPRTVLMFFLYACHNVHHRVQLLQWHPHLSI